MSGGVKNKTLRFRTNSFIDAVNNIDEYYKIGHELKELGGLITSMALHMSDLQTKVDSQAEELKKHQQKNEVQNG